jgi:cyclase|tara:strand:+ start:369 stop:1130 length:762 start_codon:yes stop_codon:yes gene_type:complete
MLRPRIMPCLLLKDGSLVKTVKFDKPSYVGDAVNAIKIFNEKEVDELLLIDISKKEIPFDVIRKITRECFMPLCYGGNVKTIENMRTLFQLGIEKIVVNDILFDDINLVKEAIKLFGSQSIVASVDIKKNVWGVRKVYRHSNKKILNLTPIEYVRQLESLGVGEILLYSVDRDGTWEGMDIDLIKEVTNKTHLPVISCGGVGKLKDIEDGILNGSSGVAIGSMCVYSKKDMGVLIKFPKKNDINKIIENYENL